MARMDPHGTLSTNRWQLAAKGHLGILQRDSLGDTSQEP